MTAKKKVETEDEQAVATDTVKESAADVNTSRTQKAAKAGKRSAKAAKEAEEKAVKEERKKTGSVEPQKPKIKAKPPRSKNERAGKKYREVFRLIEKDKLYSAQEALDLVAKTNPAKFDATVELHINLQVDPKQADQNVRGTVLLPAGTGKSVKIAVFAEGDDAKKATAAGADKVGSDNLVAELDKQLADFDILITTPAMMPQLAKYARFLGPKGLMPNPKSGTVATDLARAVNESRSGRLEYRIDAAGIIHAPIGKVSFGPQKLQENFDAVLGSIRSQKPASTKGVYIKSIFLSTSMGPSVKVET